MKNAIVEKRERLRRARQPPERMAALLDLSRELLHPDRKKAQRYAAQALQLARHTGDELRLAEAANLLANIGRLEGRLNSAARYARIALDAARRANSRVAEAESLNNSGLVYWHRGEFDTAIRFFNDTLALCTPDTGDSEAAITAKERLTAMACANLSIVNWEQGALAKAMDYQQQSLEIRQRLGDVYGIGLSYLNIGLIYGDMGDWDKAVECYYRALVEFERHGDKADMALCYNNLGEVYLRRNKLEKAEELLANAIRFAEAGASDWVKAEALGNLGELYFRQGDRLRAAECYEQDQRFSAAMNDKEELAETWRRTAELLLAEGETDEACRALGKARKLTRATGARKEAGNIERVWGNCCTALGEPAQARAAFEQGLKILRSVGSSYELGRCLLDYGRALNRWGETAPAAGCFREAEAIFRRLGAQAELDAAVLYQRRGGAEFLEPLCDLAARCATPAELGIRVRELLRDLTGQEQQTGIRKPEQEKTEPALIGAETTLKGVMALIEQVAPTRASVLIQGESGTGKELIARLIHNRSERAAKPFVAINCAAIPETLLESELFGIEKGTATGVSARKGKLERASGGTVFLDEIGDMPLTLQAKLLRVLQERVIEPVGGREAVSVDLRIIAATNQDLEQAIRAGRFREDLYWRLNVVAIVLPPLRERRQDIPALAQHFVEKYAREYSRPVTGVSDGARTALLNHPWPGNIRELEHVIERAVILARGSMITVAELPAEIAGAADIADYRTAKHYAQTEAQVITREFLLAALNRCNWNISRTAQRLQLTRRHLYRLLDRYRLRRHRN